MDSKELFYNKLKHISTNYQLNIPARKKKNNGIYYTNLDLTDRIIEDLLRDKSLTNIHKMRFLEPSVGIGNFVFSYLNFISQEVALNKSEVLELYSNIYVCDFDSEAIDIYLSLLFESSLVFFDTELPKNFTPNIGGALVYDLNSSDPTYIDISTYFGNQKYDIIVTNPPYKSLRAEKRNFDSLEQFEITKNSYKKISSSANLRYNLTGNSSPNIFKYFVEDILTNYSTHNSIIGLLIPSSILTDRSSLNIRKHILENTNLRNVVSIPENNKYINAQQALTYLTLENNVPSNKVTIIKNIENSQESVTADTIDFLDENSDYSIITLSKDEYEVFHKMKAFKKVKDLTFISNLRGELDLSINKQHIQSTETAFKLVRGRHVKPYQLNVGEIDEYISPEFIIKSAKSKFISKERIACQQIVNIHKDQRLTFAKVPPNYVLGNSCNFVYVAENEYNIDLNFILGLFNSELLNWYFKLFSSNNHVNNYELDNLPVPTHNPKLIKSISKAVEKLQLDPSNVNKKSLEEKIFELFSSSTLSTQKVHLDKKNIDDKPKRKKTNLDFEVTAIETLKLKRDLLNNNYVLNNHHYSLSSLDKEIIQAVSPGGNWKDLPQSTVNKSKRLQGIQKSGGRTTLYGRLKYNAPSYTITTYFNRPGNGCNIHPEFDRVLSTREAARLQGFPDHYYFYGNQKDILNQIGNAVPSLIGYLIGKKLREKLYISSSIDLFSGAGGLLYGAKMAGIKHLAANDIDKSACTTLKINNPEIDVICDDITSDSAKEKLISISNTQNADVIFGGPPCQGFSLAGYRNSSDPRNQLFRDFIYLVEKITPKVLVFENVLGLLSYNNGETFEEIKSLFESIGYDIHAKVLAFQNFAVPQKRKRVIIIGVRKDLNADPKSLFPDEITPKTENQVTVEQAIRDLEYVTDDNLYVGGYETEYINLMRGKLSYSDYFDNIIAKNRHVSEMKQLNLF